VLNYSNETTRARQEPTCFVFFIFIQARVPSASKRFGSPVVTGIIKKKLTPLIFSCCDRSCHSISSSGNRYVTIRIVDLRPINLHGCCFVDNIILIAREVEFRCRTQPISLKSADTFLNFSGPKCC
jgi:hypothetical protein